MRNTITTVSRFLQGCAAAALLQPAILASPVQFADASFREADWEVLTVSSGSGGHAFSLPEQMPDRPETFRGLTLILNPGPSAVCAVHLKRGAVFDPSTAGAVASVSFRQTVRDSFGQMGPSRFGPAIRQGGRIFVAGPCPWFSGSTTSWTRVAMSSLRAFDFVELSPQGALFDRSSRPDFSPHAPPMQLGFAWWAVNNSPHTALTGGSVHHWSVTLEAARPVALRQARTMPDGEDVCVGHGIVSAAFPDFFYLSCPDRANAIRVRARRHSLAAGMSAGVIGTLGTNEHGERFIDARAVYPGSPASVRPLGMSVSALGGADSGPDAAAGRGQRGVAGGTGVNNIGLLVRTAGRVTRAAGAPAGSVILSDGRASAAVVFGEGQAMPSDGDFVTVTGISSCLAGAGGLPERAVLAVEWDRIEAGALPAQP